MKIFIGTDEIAGWIEQFKSGFCENGHEVNTGVFKRNYFYDYQYDYDLNELYTKFRYLRPLKKYNVYKRIQRKIQNRFADYQYQRAIKKLINKYDVFLIFWAPLLDKCIDYSYIKRKGKKLIILFVGSDVRYFNAFSQEFDISHWTFPDSYTKTSIEYRLSLIRNAEKYADSIYSIPDQAGLQLRPYFHLQVPIAVTDKKFIKSDRKIPIVVHAPSIPFKKGTDIIEKTLQQLKEDGISFEVLLIRNMPHRELMDVLSNADILVDEIVGFGPGGLGFEAMFCGCVVATRYLESSPLCFKPPVWNIDANNIYDKLKELITNFELRNRLIDDGREYVLHNNLTATITKNMLFDLQHPRPPDYTPAFLREQYQPVSATEIQTINQWTEMVKDCDWYKKTVKPGERAGLIF